MMTHSPYGEEEPDRRAGGDGGRPVDPVLPGPGWGQQDPAARYPPPNGPGYPPPPGQQYGQPGRYGEPQFGPPSQYGQQYGQPGQYGEPGRYGPQYGVPGQPGPWGQPPAPTRRSRRPLVFGLVALAAVAVAVLLSVLLRPTALDPQAVQRDVAGQFAQRQGVSVQLRCTDDMRVAVGERYRCSGTTAGGHAVTITITVTSRDADYTWSQR